MALDTLIKTVYSENYEKNLENELVLDKLSATKYAANLKMGDEMDVELPGQATLQKWDGGDLQDVEEAGVSVAKIKVDQGMSANFEISQAKAVQINKSNTEEATKLAKEYSNSANYQFADAIDSKIGQLYATAGLVLNNGTAITVTTDNILKVLSNMKALFSRKKAWVTGKMAAFLPPEMTAILNQVPNLTNSEAGHKERAKGWVRELSGWQIYESNNIAADTDGYFYPLFGVIGETTASVKQKNMELIPYMREKSINKAYKGAGVFGVGTARPDKLGTAKIKATLSF